MTEAEILASIVKRIEAVRDEKKLLSGSERDLFAEAKGKNIDGKALRRVLQRRAMDDADREAFDDLVDQYEQALAGKAVAAAALKAGATVREAAKAGGVSVSTAQRTKNRVSGTERAATSSAPEGGGEGKTPPPDPLTEPPAGGEPPLAGPTQAVAAPPSAIPAGAPDGVPGSASLAYTNDAARCEGQDSAGTDDHDWERRDGAATYDGVRQIQRDTLVASGQARLHPVEMTPAEAEAQRRSFAYGNVSIGNPSITREMVDQAAERMAVEMPEIPDWLRRA